MYLSHFSGISVSGPAMLISKPDYETPLASSAALVDSGLT